MQQVDDPAFVAIEDAVELEGYTFEGYTDPTTPLIALETLLNCPPSWRKRRLQIGVLLAVLLLTLLTFGHILAPRLPGKTPAASGSSRDVLITSNVSYGIVTINGRQQAGSMPRRVAMDSTAKLTVTLDAVPLQPISCSVPPTHPVPLGVFNPCVLSDYSPPDNQPVVVLTLLLGVDALSAVEIQ